MYHQEHISEEAKIKLVDQFKINDAHVHIGKQPMINQSWFHRDLFDYKDSVSRVLIMSAGKDPITDNVMVKQLSSMNDWIYGLHWVTSIHGR